MCIDIPEGNTLYVSFLLYIFIIYLLLLSIFILFVNLSFYPSISLSTYLLWFCYIFIYFLYNIIMFQFSKIIFHLLYNSMLIKVWIFIRCSFKIFMYIFIKCFKCFKYMFILMVKYFTVPAQLLFNWMDVTDSLMDI